LVNPSRVRKKRGIIKRGVDFLKQAGPYSIGKGKVMKFTGTGCRIPDSGLGT
jgi:hypothetical protein